MARQIPALPTGMTGWGLNGYTDCRLQVSMLQNNEIAILVLSTILEEEIIALYLLPQETSLALGNRFFTVYRLDFSVRIKTREGAIKHVVIEIQKAKFATDTMRFRRYLGEQYRKGFMLEGDSKVQKAIPIISIYFLGYQLKHVQVPVVDEAAYPEEYRQVTRWTPTNDRSSRNPECDFLSE